MPSWLAVYAGRAALPSELMPAVWHAHEMIFGYAAAVVAGFLLTAIPNWTGRMPLQGAALAALVLLWAGGRIAVLLSGMIGATAAAMVDLSFPAVFLAVVAREILVGRNWRNLPMIGALSLLLAGNALVHLEPLGIADSAGLGNRVGLATLLMLISLVGGRIIPSFTHNWLSKKHPEAALPAPAGRFDLAALFVNGLALAGWVAPPDAAIASWAALIAGAVTAIRLSRWKGRPTFGEPLLLVLHIGYGWLGLGLLLLGLNGLFHILPATAALHALTVGAVGTMTLAVMTRASLGHTGRPLRAGPGTEAIYVLITLAALSRVLSPLAGDEADLALWLAGISWTAAFGLFVACYGGPLAQPRVVGDQARPI